MSTPGWYPDPSGQPGQFRHWDGSQWSTQTTTDPRSPAPGGPATGRPPGGRGPLVIVAVGVLVLALAAFIVVRITRGDGPGAGEDTNSSTPTVSSWDETSSPTPSPDDPSGKGGTQMACPVGGPQTEKGTLSDGRLRGGGISIPSLGWRFGTFQTLWMDQTAEETLPISGTWVSTIAVGRIVRTDFPEPKVAADRVLQCLASSQMYRGFTGRKDLTNEAVTIDGHKGQHLKSEVYVDGQGPTIPGDVVDIVVLDTGDSKHLSLFFSTATIGDKNVIADVERVRAGLQVG